MKIKNSLLALALSLAGTEAFMQVDSNLQHIDTISSHIQPVTEPMIYSDEYSTVVAAVITAVFNLLIYLLSRRKKDK